MLQAKTNSWFKKFANSNASKDGGEDSWQREWWNIVDKKENNIRCAVTKLVWYPFFIRGRNSRVSCSYVERVATRLAHSNNISGRCKILSAKKRIWGRTASGVTRVSPVPAQAVNHDKIQPSSGILSNIIRRKNTVKHRKDLCMDYLLRLNAVFHMSWVEHHKWDWDWIILLANECLNQNRKKKRNVGVLGLKIVLLRGLGSSVCGL